MERRRKKIIERLNGLGKIKTGDKLYAYVSYNLLVQRDVLINDSFNGVSEAEGNASITGNFKVMDRMMDWKVNFDSDGPYTLELDDQREFDILIPRISNLPISKYDIIVADASKFQMKG